LVLIRPAAQQDVEPILAIYNHYILHSPATFDVQPYRLDERGEWFAQFTDSGPYRVVVAEDEEIIVGYACSTPFRPKPAYATSVEVTVYVEPDHTGRGIGRRLYGPLLEALEGEDVHRAYAVIVLPNPASIRLHERLGFREAATLREVGRKFGKYWDVSWYQRSLDPS
jgi:phosphinothricin acetyltransferase